MKVKNSLENLDVYREAIELAKDVYQLILQSKIRQDYSLADQMRRSAVSIAANIAEGYGRQSKKDFAHFLSISLGSLNELRAYFDFTRVIFDLDTTIIRDKYAILGKRIYSLRAYLLGKQTNF